MYAQRNYSFWMTFRWSIRPFIIGLIYAFLILFIQKQTEISLNLPWQPISIIGIAVAFYLGFKNNSSYDRTWEARKIWGGIVNSSRMLGALCAAALSSETNIPIARRIIRRYVAWLTALRYQLRLSKPWEHTEARLNELYMPTICEGFMEKLHKDIQNLLPDNEYRIASNKSNIAAQILFLQIKDIETLHAAGVLNEYTYLKIQDQLEGLYAEQGKSERIKNFPFPRQYASTALWMTYVFCILLPFGVLNSFKEMGDDMVWLAAPFSALVTWVFFLMEKIGDYSENPFEGSYNDVPISSIARGIEIDLFEMIDEKDIPPPIPTQNGFLM